MRIDLGDFNDIKKHIHSRLLSNEFHLDRLKGIYKIPVTESLYLTFFISLGEQISIPITGHMVDMLKIGVSDLKRAAKSNSRYAVKSINELFGFEIDAFRTGLADVCIVTNLSAQGGASAILDKRVQDQLSERFPNGYFVIPSSVDETLIIHNDLDTDKICQMIHDINRNYVEESLRLSDHLYAIRDGQLVVVA